MQIDTHLQQIFGRNRTRQKKTIPKYDMTPMVDLGFLLISFFVITTEMSRPATTDLFMPRDDDEMPVANSTALTFLLSNEHTAYYYAGEWDHASRNNLVRKISFQDRQELRRIILQHQDLLAKKNIKDGKKALMLLIKPGPDAFYGNVVDMLDECLIHQVTRYAVVPPSSTESHFLAN